jgi:MazG family protein
MSEPTSPEKQSQCVPRSAGDAFLALCDVMTHLRSNNGCDWDKVQTLETLRPYLLEETYEVLDVLDSMSRAGTAHESAQETLAKAHRSELGDLLLQIIFQAEIQRENQAFHVGDVADAVREKLERRHPHLFGTEEQKAEGRIPWEKLKEQERMETTGTPKGALDGVPQHLPALLKALRTGEKANGVGFDWPDHQGVVEKIEEEVAEVKEAITAGSKSEIEHEIGDLLYATVNLCRHFSVDPEAALRRTIHRFETRFQWVEEKLADEGRRADQCQLDELESIWQQAKEHLA